MTTPANSDDASSRLLAQREIESRLLAYTRGIDRLDADLVAAGFHPGAQLVGYGPEPMTIETFVEFVIPRLRSGFSATQHRVSNLSTEFRSGDQAVLESYVLAFHVQPVDDGPDRLHTFNGRYVDRFELRDAEWKISERQLRVDWSKVEDLTETMGDDKWIPSARDRSDAVYD